MRKEFKTNEKNKNENQSINAAVLTKMPQVLYYIYIARNILQVYMKIILCMEQNPIKKVPLQTYICLQNLFDFAHSSNSHLLITHFYIFTYKRETKKKSYYLFVKRQEFYEMQELSISYTDTYIT